jgi:RND family efflux transporter MFP subunit
MIRLLLPLTLLLTALYSVEIPTEQAKLQKFGKTVDLNAQVVQLSNAKQNIMSMVGGHIEKYYVKPAQKVKKGDRVALIESIMLSKMTAEYLSLQEQYRALNKNYESTKKLYDKGMTSQQELNNQSIKRDAMRSQINALRSQLNTMGIRTKSLRKASSDYILYAHSDGKVSEILQPLHSVINEETPIVTIVKRSDSYIKSFLPLEYASKVKVGQRVVVHYGKRELTSHVTQIMPEVDQTTQRIVVLSSIDDKTVELFINAYVGATLYFDATEEFVAVKKSALSFFNNEWVVFLPVKEEHGEEERGKREEEKDDDHDEHGEHEEHEVPYEVRVVEIIVEDEDYAAVNGIEAGEAYVSAKSYYVKSMILKSSLGEHGH